MGNKSIKKLVNKILSDYNISSVNEASIKSMIAGEGYTVIRYSAMGSTGETQRLLEALYLDERATYRDSFTYNDRERRIVFIRRDVSEDEYLYLLALELGRIKTFRTEADGVVGISASEEKDAHEFAYHLCDMASSNVLHNFLKFHPVQCIVSALSFIICLSIVFSFLFVKSCSADNTAADVFKNADVVSASADNTTTDGVSAIVGTGAVGTASSGSVTDVQFTATEYVATKSGTKYHKKDCGHVKGKSVKIVSAEDISSGKYTACSVCIK